MDLSRPHADVVPGARGKVLAALVRSTEPITIRALASRASTSPQGTADIVSDLEDAGIVASVRAGRAHMVSLNRSHLAYEPIAALVGLRNQLVVALEAELDTWKGLDGAWLFGSAARGDGDAESDIDILLLGRDLEGVRWEAQVADLHDRVATWTGNEPEILEYDERGFDRMLRRGTSLARSLRTEAIPLTVRSRGRLRRAA
jgi:predicted nucleotidyltransferase